MCLATLPTVPTDANAVNITLDFLAAGRAIFTVANPTGESYTYRVSRSEPSGEYSKPAWFVGLLTGPDNEHDYTYVGRYDPDMGTLSLTQASRFGGDSKPVKVFRWVVATLAAGRSFPAGYTVQHCGRCGRCARTLTTPRSLEIGIGPECERKMMGGK